MTYFLQRLPAIQTKLIPCNLFYRCRPQRIHPGRCKGATHGSRVGGVEEFQFVFDPFKAAQLGIDLTAVANELGRANDISGGFVDVGKRYTHVLKVAEPTQMGEMILEWQTKPYR